MKRFENLDNNLYPGLTTQLLLIQKKNGSSGILTKKYFLPKMSIQWNISLASFQLIDSLHIFYNWVKDQQLERIGNIFPTPNKMQISK